MINLLLEVSEIISFSTFHTKFHETLRVTKMLKNVLRNRGAGVQKFGTSYVRISQNFNRHTVTLQEGDKMGRVLLIY